MAIDLPRVVRVTAHQLIGTAPIQNVFHFVWRDLITTPNAADLTALLNKVGAADTNPLSLGYLMKERDAETGFVRLDAQSYDLPFPTVASKQYSSLGEIVTGADLPDFTAYRIDWTTGLGGRWFRGRSFVGGLAASQINADGNTLAATTTAQTQVRIDAFTAAWNADLVWAFSVFSRVRAEAQEPVSFAEVLSGTIWPNVTSMVSRRINT